MATPQVGDMNDATTITMETMEDTSLPNDGPSTTVLPPPSPASAGDDDPQGSYPPESPPPETATMDLALNDTDSGGVSETLLLTSWPSPNDTIPNPPPIPSSSVYLLANPSASSCSPISEATLNRPLLASAGKGAFDLTSVRGDLISEGAGSYWELVPGGER